MAFALSSSVDHNISKFQLSNRCLSCENCWPLLNIDPLDALIISVFLTIIAAILLSLLIFAFQILTVGADPILNRFDMNGAILSQIPCAPPSAFSISLHPAGVCSDSKLLVFPISHCLFRNKYIFNYINLTFIFSFYTKFNMKKKSQISHINRVNVVQQKQ